MPDLKGKLDGISIRVPTPNVSLVDLVVLTEKKATAEDVNAAFREAARGPMKNILEVSEGPLVSIDFRGDAHSSIIDAPYTAVIAPDFIKVLAWYDNEWAYSCRCVDMVRMMARRGL